LLQKSIIFFDLNAAALSVMILLGQLKRDKIFDSKKRMIIISMACLVGIASIHLVK